MESIERRGSRDSLDSLLSHDSFQGEMDNFLKELRQNTKSAEPPRKKDIDEDNISEEKVKLELVENEKGDNEKNLDIPQSPEQRADSPWSETSDPGISSPEPDDRSPGRATASDSQEESGMDSDSERASSRPSDSYDEDDFEDYDMTEDQQKAMLELQQMKLDLQDVGYEEDPPEYDVAERVRKLNEELANDPTPLEDDRERSIKFKDNLVDLVAPPPDYPSDEEEGAAGSGRGAAARNGGASNVTELNLNQMNLNGDSGQGAGGGDASGPPPRPASRAKGVSFGDQRTVNVVEECGGGGDNHVSTTNGSTAGGKRAVVENGDTGADDEKILVQRGSTFELISAKDLTAEEREIFLPPPDNDEDDAQNGQPQSVNSSDSGRPISSASAPDPSFQPTPPREPRPATANGAHRRPVAPQPRRRAQSAAPARQTDHGGVHLNSSYKSPYAQPDELKKIGERQKRDKLERDRRQREIDRLEEAQKEHQKEEHFLAWLQKKRSDGAWRKERPTEDETTNAKKKEEKMHSDDGSTQDKEREAAFQEWLKTKKTQQKREKQVEEQRHQEEEQSWFDRPRQECDKAFRQYVFKEWLKKKKEDTKKAKKQEVARARINKLLVRRTRKAMQLARAIRQSQNYRYVDYYGYRS